MHTKKVLALCGLTLLALPMAGCSLFKCKHEETTVQRKIEATCSSTGYTGDTVCVKCEEIVSSGQATAALAHDVIVEGKVEATCTQEGNTGSLKCQTCGAITEEGTVIPKLEHDGELTNAKEATCLEKGYTGDMICKLCGETYEQGTVLEITDHKWTEIAVEKEADCKQAGKHTVKCDYCASEQEEVVPQLEHVIVNDPSVSADCTNAGKTEGKHCSLCNTVLEKQKTVPALGHVVVVDTQGTNPTCVKEGKASVSHCSRCNKKLSDGETLAATGHKATSEPAVAATCTVAGKTEKKTCSVCKEVLEEAKTIPAKGHTEETIPAVAATCTTAGSAGGKKCTTCGVETQKPSEVVALGHQIVDSPEVQATCTTAGVRGEKKCSRCGVTTTPGTAVPAKGHTNAPINNAVVATCTTKGKEADQKCVVCNEVTVIGKEIPTLAHQPVSANNGKEATCIAKGKSPDTICSMCQTLLVKGEVSPALGHKEVSAENAVAPTCELEGRESDTICSVCYTTIKQGKTIAKLDHSPVEADTGIAPTCEGAGRESDIICSECGDTLEIGKVLMPLGHKPEKKGEDIAATCTEKGMTAAEICTVCEQVIVPQSEIPVIPHTEVEIPAVAATCTEEGLTAGKKCSVCGLIIVEQEIVPVVKHTPVVVTPAIAPTCTNTGMTEATKCSVCDQSLSIASVVDALGHEMKKLPAVEATCTSTGLTEGEMCERCSFVAIEQTVTMVLPHEEVIDKGYDKTCDKDGLSDGIHCGTCGTVLLEQNVIPAGHNVVTDFAEEGNCTYPGKTEGSHCADCGVVLVEQETLGLGDHVWTEMDETRKMCIICGITEDGTVEAAVKVGTDFYNSIEEAVAALKESGSQEPIVLLKNLTLNAPMDAMGLTIDMNGFDINGDVIGTIKVSNGNYITSQGYKMIGPDADYFQSDDAVFTLTNATGDVTIHSGSVTLKQSWWTLPGQNLTIEEGATFTIPAGVNLNVLSNVVVKGEAIIEGTVTLYTIDATITAPEGLPHIITSVGETVMYIDGKYVVHNHTPGAEATCLNPQICTICSVELDAKKDHNIIDVPPVAPTCTEPGIAAGTRCQWCDTQNQGFAPVDPTGHSYTNDSVSMVLSNKDAETIDVDLTCLECGNVESVVGTISEKELLAEPTCSQTGAMTCKVTTNTSIGEVIINANFTLNKTPHTPVVTPAVDYTCTTDGKTEGTHCDVCGETITPQDTIEAHHLFNSIEGFVFNEDYTECTVTAKCANCEATKEFNATVLTKTVVVEKTCEVGSEIKYEVSYVDGSATYKGFITVKEAKLGHNYIAGVCDNCGDVRNIVNDWYKTEFDKKEVENIYIVKTVNKTFDEEWNIDSEDFGYSKAYRVGKDIYISTEGKSSIYAPETCSLFAGFTAVKKIEGLDLLTTVACKNTDNMFAGCAELTTLSLQTFNMQNVESMKNMFMDCAKLERIDVLPLMWKMNSINFEAEYNEERGDFGMFNGCVALVGGNGFAYATNTDDLLNSGVYAVVDTDATPGYFTLYAPVLKDEPPQP